MLYYLVTVYDNIYKCLMFELYQKLLYGVVIINLAEEATFVATKNLT